jgi:hypothetical protein
MQFALMALVAAGGVTAAIQQRNAGIIASNQYTAQVRTEGNAAKQREIERRQALMRTLATTNARAGAMGVETSGSIGGIIRKDIKENQQDLLVNAANYSARRRDLLTAASNARQQGNLAAVGSLLDTAAQMGQMAVGGGKPPAKLS